MHGWPPQSGARALIKARRWGDFGMAERPFDRRGAPPVRRGTSRALLRCLLLLGAALLAPAAWATDAETQFIVNTFSFLVWGTLVMWMCAGFTMLEAGSVRTKNASVICLKNVGLYSIAGIMYYLIGYNLMYTDVGSFIGSFQFFHTPSAAEQALLDGGGAAETIESGYSSGSNWFFQMVFVATTASIISGTLAERVRLWSFLAFTAVLTAVIYPVVGAWIWGEGWLFQLGFQDFAGSTVVHSTGGWAALVGAIMVGPRRHKYRADGSIRTTPPSNVPIVTLGVFILWLGWFGFNGGSQLALGSAANAVAMSNVLVNTNLAAAGGVIAALSVSQMLFGRVDLLATLNGAIAGLVSITAGPDIVDHHWAIIIGAVGGVLCSVSMKLLEQWRVDDVVGAISGHLVAGIWGTLAACIAAGASFVPQLVGIVAIGVFVSAASFIVWFTIGKTIGLRVTDTVEAMGQDVAELKIEAYPEFVLMPDQEDTEEIGKA